MRNAVSFFLALSVFAGTCLDGRWSCSAATGDQAYELTRDGRKITGRLLAGNGQKGYLLGVDGWLWSFGPAEAASLSKTAAPFHAASPSLLRGMLLREWGAGYEVTGAGRYMIAHNAGKRDLWADRFDKFYRSFFHYFTVRGIQLKEPPCLLAGVVCRNRDDFVRKSREQGLGAAAGIVGWYNLESNRLMIYDMQSKAATDRWQSSAAVLLHEATHQLAFNTGIHNRCAPPPMWVVEGLATLFEAPGMYDSLSYGQFEDRFNTEQLSYFRKVVRSKFAVESLQAMVASDAMFRDAPLAAYAQAWALTFYLTEAGPRKYAAYLARTSARKPFTVSTSAERLADFTAVFGSNWPMLHAQFLRFIDAAR